MMIYGTPSHLDSVMFASGPKARRQAEVMDF
jgi:hypothetical protein